MIPYDRFLALLAESDATVRRSALLAFARLLEKIRAGMNPRAALKAVLKEFNADTLAGFREALNAVLQSSLSLAEVKAYPVGRVKLSDALYANAKAVAVSAQTIIEKHLQGVHDARELRKALYEGYHFQDDPLKVIKPLPKYLQVEFDKFKAASLKTPALRAAYLDAIRRAEAGAGMAALEKKLKVAFYERNRYFANRIAQTELHRNYTDQQAREWMATDDIQFLQWRMSRTHPKADQCDAMAKVDRYGLGPGIFPKALAPQPPAHPFCLPGDALITASGRIAAVSKRWYDGDMAVITTTSGQKLAATVNHPVLTPGGWVAIGSLQIGQQVVCRFGGERPSVIDSQHQDMPACIAEIADAFFSSRQVTAREVPTSAPDFHGDGMAGQVAVIGADSQLWDRFDAASGQGVEEGSFVFAHQVKSLLSDSIFNLCFKAFMRSTNSRMGRFSPFLFEFWRSLIHLELLRLAHGAQRYVVALQMFRDRQSADSGRLGQCQDGFPRLIISDQLAADNFINHPAFQSNQHPDLPGVAQSNVGTNQSGAESFSRYADLDGNFLDGSIGEIRADAIINVDVFRFRGHVYNLETEQGYYTSNNIITHNCRCVLSPVINLGPDARPKFNPGAERAFLASLPAREARDIAGSWEKRRRALEDGASLEALYNEGKDPLYRWKTVGEVVAEWADEK